MASATVAKSRPVQAPRILNPLLFIDGQWRPSASGKTFPTLNPATGETICQVAEGDRADIDLAVQAARKALESGPWGTLDAADRGRLLMRLADLVEGQARELAALESLNCGKLFNDALGDVQGVVNTLLYYRGPARKHQ